MISLYLKSVDYTYGRNICHITKKKSVKNKFPSRSAHKYA
jgi:hypothetical protein